MTGPLAFRLSQTSDLHFEHQGRIFVHSGCAAFGHPTKGAVFEYSSSKTWILPSSIFSKPTGYRNGIAWKARRAVLREAQRAISNVNCHSANGH